MNKNRDLFNNFQDSYRKEKHSTDNEPSFISNNNSINLTESSDFNEINNIKSSEIVVVTEKDPENIFENDELVEVVNCYSNCRYYCSKIQLRISIGINLLLKYKNKILRSELTHLLFCL